MLPQPVSHEGPHVIPLSQDATPPATLQRPRIPMRSQMTPPLQIIQPTHHPQQKPPPMRPILQQSKPYPITHQHATHGYNTRARSSQAANFLRNLPPVHLANAVIVPDIGFSLEYRHLVNGDDAITWTASMANELGPLTQGVGTRISTGTNTVFFVTNCKFPKINLPCMAES